MIAATPYARIVSPSGLLDVALEISIPLLVQFQQTIPLLFADIEPLARQIDNLKLPR